MEAVWRAAAIYFFYWLIFRIAGKRTLSEMTSFDFILLLMIGEATQQALLGDNYSITHALIVGSTLIFLDVMLSNLKERYPQAEHAIEGVPVIVMQDGKMLQDRMRKERIDAEDILTAAREAHGIERLDQIKYAILERSGGISIVPRG